MKILLQRQYENNDPRICLECTCDRQVASGQYYAWTCPRHGYVQQVNENVEKS